MNKDNALRELEKIEDALAQAFDYHALTNEANAKLHGSDKVMYSPLTNKLGLAIHAAKALRNELS